MFWMLIVRALRSRIESNELLFGHPGQSISSRMQTPKSTYSTCSARRRPSCTFVQLTVQVSSHVWRSPGSFWLLNSGVCRYETSGFTAVSITNPIWFVKTRLQLDETKRGLTTADVVKKIFKNKGIAGFYKGISASYFGITETALYFVIYEKLKSMSRESSSSNEHVKFLTIFFSAGFSKTLASCLCYPHGKWSNPPTGHSLFQSITMFSVDFFSEVARTRLRQEGCKYNGFFQTLALVAREEGVRGLYKGMATHLIRQIPNTAIVMTSYELLIRYFEWDALTRNTAQQNKTQPTDMQWNRPKCNVSEVRR